VRQKHVTKEAAHCLKASKQREGPERSGDRTYFSGNTPNDLFPPNRPYLLEVIIHSIMNPSVDESIDEIRILMI
jgi:hypothetical protein